MIVRDARLADPDSFNEEKTWYRRHTKPHTTAEWGSTKEQWAAEAAAVAVLRSRDPEPEEVGLGDSSLWGEVEGEDGGADY